MTKDIALVFTSLLVLMLSGVIFAQAYRIERLQRREHEILELAGKYYTANQNLQDRLHRSDEAPDGSN